MSPEAILGPFFSMMLLTGGVWILMYVRRIRFLTQNEVDPRDLEVPGALAAITPASVSNPSDNLKNLFEIPVLFYALALLLYVTERVDLAYLAAAWVFVAFRVLHSLVHCTVNRVMVRFYLYLTSTLAVWFMVGRAVLQQLLGAGS